MLRPNATYLSETATVTLTDTSDSGVDGGPDFYAPAPVSELLQLTRAVSWTESTDAPTDLARFSMGEAGTQDIVVLTDAGGSVGAGLSVSSDLASEAAVTDDELLRGLFQFIALGDGSFRIASTKHGNYALDIEDLGGANALVLRDTRGGDRDLDAAGYLAFTLAGSSPVVLSATGRWAYNSASAAYEEQTWTTRNVDLSGGALTLTTGSGTSITLYDATIDLDIPFDLNPAGTSRVTNAEVPPETNADLLSSTPGQVVADYAEQVTTAGNDTATAAAALTMLLTIDATLEAEGASMRYPVEFYTAFREGLFARTLQSAESTDGELGQLTVPYVYFTLEADADGDHHPFMVIASYGLPDTLALLWDVARPPGDGLSQGYANQAVTRSFHREGFMHKIPLRDYGEVESLGENVMDNDLASDVGVTDFDHHNYASTSSTGVAIDGVVIYPSYNNALNVAQTAGELSAHGMHSGRGLGVHYHTDTHSASAVGLNLYNATDYLGHSHPPIISVGFDGVAGYGVYADGDSTSDGVGIGLDDFGGHEHGEYGYHYHAYTVQETTDGGVVYTGHKLPPLGAWAGRINDIPEFWEANGPSVYKGTL